MSKPDHITAWIMADLARAAKKAFDNHPMLLRGNGTKARPKSNVVSLQKWREARLR
jgi:hypothetical protein